MASDEPRLTAQPPFPHPPPSSAGAKQAFFAKEIGGEGEIRAESRGATAPRAVALEAHPSRQRRAEGEEVGGEGGIRTHVPVTRQDAFEAPPLRPLRYLSAEAGPIR